MDSQAIEIPGNPDVPEWRRAARKQVVLYLVSRSVLLRQAHGFELFVERL